MEIATIKAVLDACYQAQRIRAMLPTLPDGVTPSYIHFFDLIETMEQKGMRVKVSDISDRLGIPRPGVTRTVKEMEAKGYLQKVSSAQDKRVTYLSMTEAGKALSRKYNEEFFSQLAPLLLDITEADADCTIRTITKMYDIMSERRISLT
mgnify:FL=1